jgi:hypothetical protein
VHSTSSWESKVRVQTAQSRIRRGDNARGRKELFHAIRLDVCCYDTALAYTTLPRSRYRVFADALLQNGRIVPDLSCANHWWFGLCQEGALDELVPRIQAGLEQVGERMRTVAVPIYTELLETGDVNLRECDDNLTALSPQSV